MPSCFLYSGDELKRGQRIVALNKDYSLVHQFDGNVVIYDGDKATWATNTYGRDTTNFIMQTDGNLVLYNGRKAIWASGTQGKGGIVCIMQDNGECAIMTKTDDFIYTFGVGLDPNSPDFDHTKIPNGGSLPVNGSLFTPGRTAAMRIFQGTLQFQVNKGDFVSYNVQGVKYMAVQDEGNVCLYGNSSKPILDFKVNSAGGKAVMLLENGNLVLVDDENTTLENAYKHTIKVLIDYSTL